MFGRFFIRNLFSSVALCDDIDIIRCRIFLRIFWYMWKVCRILPLIDTPTQKFRSWFSVFSSQDIGSGFISFEMIFEALQSEPFRLKFQRLISKILKFPEFNLPINANCAIRNFLKKAIVLVISELMTTNSSSNVLTVIQNLLKIEIWRNTTHLNMALSTVMNETNVPNNNCLTVTIIHNDVKISAFPEG